MTVTPVVGVGTLQPFNGINSVFTIVASNIRQEQAPLQPGDASLFGLTDEQTIAALRGGYFKRRTVATTSFFNKFQKASIDWTEFQALANPALGIVTINAENFPFAGYIDSVDLAYNFQGDHVEITIVLMYAYPWAIFQTV